MKSDYAVFVVMMTIIFAIILVAFIYYGPVAGVVAILLSLFSGGLIGFLREPEVQQLKAHIKILEKTKIVEAYDIGPDDMAPAARRGQEILDELAQARDERDLELARRIERDPPA